MVMPSAQRAAPRALFLDVDGTLTDGDDPISPAVVTAVRRAHEHGWVIVLCTGRTHFRTESVACELGIVSYLVTANGAMVSDGATGQSLRRRLLPADVAVTVCRLMTEAGGLPYIYSGEDDYGPDGPPVLYHPDMERPLWAGSPRYQPYPGLLEGLPFDPIAISTFGDEATIRNIGDQLRAALSDSVSVVTSGTDYAWGVEVYAPGTNKQLAITWLADQLDITRAATAAIGDHVNDIEMLQWAGIGIAMGNARPEVKAVADYETATLANDGVAHAIERWLLTSDRNGGAECVTL